MIKASIKVGLTMALSLKASTLDKSTLLLKQVPYIYHPIWFKKEQAKVQVLLDFSSKVNVITPVYTVRLGLKI